MKHARILSVLFALVAGAWAPALAQDASGSEPEPLKLSLKNCVLEAFKNNEDIKIASYMPDIREQDLLFEKAQFDATLTGSALHGDASFPRYELDPNGTQESIGEFDYEQSSLNVTYEDRLRFGATWSAALVTDRQTTARREFIFTGTGFNEVEFETEDYQPRLDLTFRQSLLKNFGRSVNETPITLAATNRDIDIQNFKTRVQVMLVEVEDAYWTLVYGIQDLEVRKEALQLAQELLRLNKIRVEVGTLPPIDITQAEAGVASREEAVIVAEANIENAEDRLRRVIGLDPQDPKWKRRIIPTEDLGIIEREVDLEREIEKAIANRTDLASARLQLRNSDTSLAYQKNQLKYSLDLEAVYSLRGRAGRQYASDVLGIQEGEDTQLADAYAFITGQDFPSWQVTATLGIPIGNRAAEAQYVKARLEREQASIAYKDYEQAAIVQVGVAVRRVLTDLKRIEAAEKNRILQEKTVEAEQRKFENGLSTSFEVLQLQKDLAEARSAENAARRDYRISLTNLDAATGILEQAKGIRIDDYTRD